MPGWLFPGRCRSRGTGWWCRGCSPGRSCPACRSWSGRSPWCLSAGLPLHGHEPLQDRWSGTWTCGLVRQCSGSSIHWVGSKSPRTGPRVAASPHQGRRAQDAPCHHAGAVLQVVSVSVGLNLFPLSRHIGWCLAEIVLGTEIVAVVSYGYRLRTCAYFPGSKKKRRHPSGSWVPRSSERVMRMRRNVTASVNGGFCRDVCHVQLHSTGLWRWNSRGCRQQSNIILKYMDPCR